MPESGGFDIVGHTADVRVEATGDSLEGALAWLATGMFSTMANVEKVEPREKVSFRVSSSSVETLAVDWLNELLYLFEAEAFLPAEYAVDVGADAISLKAECTGERADPKRHELRPGVKAATYHDVIVSQDGSWRIRVVLDV